MTKTLTTEELREKFDQATPEQKRKVLAFFGLDKPEIALATCDFCHSLMPRDDMVEWENLVVHAACAETLGEMADRATEKAYALLEAKAKEMEARDE